MAVTTKDIAKIAGVSQSTVSRCLNDSPLISAETRYLVKQIALKHGFEFNANARSLSTNRTGTIGLIYPENFHDFNNSLYLNALHNQLRDSLEKENLDLIMSFAWNRYTGDSNIRKLIARKKVDGFILVRNELDPETLEFLKNSGIPFVFTHHYADDLTPSGFEIITTDHVRGGALAAGYLSGLGHQKILCITSLSGGHEFEQRTQGFKAAIEESGLEYDDSLLLSAELSFRSTCQLILNNRDLMKKVTAIFAQSDIMALGAMEALKVLGIRVPEDISVIGYDDIELCTYFTPHLTTIHQPREEIAAHTCKLLSDLIRNGKSPEYQKIILQPELVIRESCRPLETLKKIIHTET